MRLQANERLYFLAFDHRAAFARAVFEVDAPTAEQERAMAAAKRLIFTGVERAIERSTVAAGTAGVLVDERYGADVALAAKSAGVAVAMPLEAPDCDLFEFAYGDAFGEHLEAFAPDFAKVLVRYNIDGDRGGNAEQAATLAGLSAWLRVRGLAFLFELIVTPTDRQLSTCGGDPERFERERRPELIRNAIADLQAAGVEPDVWKLEGIDTVADATSVVAQARGGVGREDVACVVLGAGAGEQRVAHWLRVAAAIEGFAGFAIGRSIWRDPVRKRLAGMIDEAEAADRIAAGYGRFVRLFEEAATVERSPAV